MRKMLFVLLYPPVYLINLIGWLNQLKRRNWGYAIAAIGVPLAMIIGADDQLSLSQNLWGLLLVPISLALAWLINHFPYPRPKPKTFKRF